MPPPPLPEGDKSTKGDRILTPQHHLPADIERTSLSIITAELEAQGLTPPPETAAVVKRVIHTTATLTMRKICASRRGLWQQVWPPCGPGPLSSPTPTWHFRAFPSLPLPGWAAVPSAIWRTLRWRGSQPRPEPPGQWLHAPRGAGAPRGHSCGGQCPHRPADHCGRDRGRAAACPGHCRAGGLCERGGKQGDAVCRLCRQRRACIAAMGRKGGSTVAAAVCNALVYSAAEMQDQRQEGGNKVEPVKTPLFFYAFA